MTQPIPFDLVRRSVLGALLLSTLAVVSACSSSDGRPLILVNAPLVAYPGTPSRVDVTVYVDTWEAAVESFAPSATGNFGIYLNADTTGIATASVAVFDAADCLLASGTGANSIQIKPGEKSDSINVGLVASSVPCTFDAGVEDGPVVPPSDTVGPVPEVSGDDVRVGQDGPPVVADGPLADGPPADGPSVLADVRPPDGVLTVDVVLDVVVTIPDVPLDVAAPEVQTGAELGPEAPPDSLVADADGPPTSLNVLNKCTTYTHSLTDSEGVVEDWGIRQLAFSPDGQTLISFGEDERAKVWTVTATGLVEPSSKLEFLGSGYGGVNGTISQDGKYVAVGDSESQVIVYDLPASLAFGSPTTKWSLPPDSLSPLPWKAVHLQFTTDGNHLVVAYTGSNPDPNFLVVWDLATQQIVRKVEYPYEDWPMAILPGKYTDPMWIASAQTIDTDAGDYLSTVTLMDVSQTSPVKAQFTVPGMVEVMAFSPDGTSLAVGLDTGEVALWDITSKASIVRLGSPLITGSASGSNSAYSLSFAADGKYLAAGIGDFWGSSSVRVVLLQQKQTLQKTIVYLPWSVAFAPNGLAVAVGERDDGILLYCTP